MSISLPVRLRALRAARGWTLEEAAEEVGINPDNLSKLERGFRKPRVGTLAKIADAYGVPVEELMQVEEAAPLGKADPLAGAGEYTKSRGLAGLLYSLGSETAHLANPKLGKKVEEVPIRQLFNLLDELNEELDLLTPEITRLHREVRSAVKREGPGLDPGLLKSARIWSDAWSEAAENFLDLRMALRSRLEVEPEEEVEVRERIEDLIELVP